MPNTNAPFGFSPSLYLNGFTANFAPSVRRIAAANGTAIFTGDPVTSLNTGYITRSTAGTTSIAGIFVGCKYYSAAARRTVWNNYWPGSDAVGDVEAYVIDAPNAMFRAQAGGSATAIGFADVGSGINFALGTGNTATGISGAYADQTTLGTTSTLPFRVVDLVRDPPGANGTDTASAYNHVILAFNFQDFRGTTLV